MHMHMHTEVSHQESTDPSEGVDAVDAEFVESTAIRRRPVGANSTAPATAETTTPAGARITMTLDKWLDVDRKLWELYNLCEIAIAQRDDARSEAGEIDSERELLMSRLREWKTYARKLEQRLHAAQIENLELSFTLKRSHDLAAEAIALPAFARGRRNELRERLHSLSDDIEG